MSAAASTTRGTTTTLFLVRHAPHAWQGEVFVGRRPGVHLAEHAPRLLERLRARFASERIDAVYASPLERAQLTAEPIAAAAGVTVVTVPGLTELELGEWTDLHVDDLRDDPGFGAWNHDRSVARPPGGESLLEAQVRMVRQAEQVRACWPDGRVVLVGHGDPLRCLVAYYLGLPLVNMDRFDLEPASVTALAMGEWGARLLFLNERVDA